MLLHKDGKDPTKWQTHRPLYLCIAVSFIYEHHSWLYGSTNLSEITSWGHDHGDNTCRLLNIMAHSRWQASRRTQTHRKLSAMCPGSFYFRHWIVLDLAQTQTLHSHPRPRLESTGSGQRHLTWTEAAGRASQSHSYCSLSVMTLLFSSSVYTVSVDKMEALDTEGRIPHYVKPRVHLNGLKKAFGTLESLSHFQYRNYMLQTIRQ